MGASQITATAQIITTPFFSANSSDRPWFVSKLIKYQLMMVGLSCLVAVSVYFVVSLLVEHLYGDEYQLVLDVLPILLIKYVVWSSFAIIGVALLGLGSFKEGTFLAAVVAPIAALVSYYLGVNYGVLGVAWGQVFSACLTLVAVLPLTYYILNKRFGCAAESA